METDEHYEGGDTTVQSDSESNGHKNDGSSSESGESFDAFRRKAQRQRVFELEQQLQIAESRCGTLKHQVEYMRMLYAGVDKEEENTAGSKEPPDSTEGPKMVLSAPKIKIKRIKTASIGTPENQRAGVVSELKEHFEQNRNKFEPKDGRLYDGFSKSVEMIPEAKHVRRGRRKRVFGLGSHPTTQDGRRARRTKRELDSRSEIPTQGSHRTGRKRRQPQVGQEDDSYATPKDSDLETETGHVDSAKPNKPGVRKEPLGEEVKWKTWERRPQTKQEEVGGYLMSYQMPTISSEMKRMPRSFMSRLNFRTIPFVVGKSTSKSHNLGMKIQETLSLIKMRNPLAGLGAEGSRRGMEGIADDKNPSSDSWLVSGDFNKLFEEIMNRDGVTSYSRSELTSSSQLFNGGLPEVTNPNTQELLRKVLQQLHDEYSTLTRRQDRLKQRKCDKDANSDEMLDVEKNLKHLDKNIEAKENEILAILQLYSEIKNLKFQIDQMKFDGLKSSIDRNFQGFFKPSRTALDKRRETVASLKMTRLLRQIERYQKRLKGLE